ncbi:hypothetical protein WDJ50_02665 [Deinococcus sp. VB142]|uniref:Uncharacterized protein n=1 Tax=Deinococcus sp. VB142 TaxID=3112952 RepID=A0AAU6Q461_9DEIO
MTGWKAELERQFKELERQSAPNPKKKTVTPAGLLALKAGDTAYFVPGKVKTAGYGQRVTVTQAAKPEALNPTARVQFPDGTQRRVQVRQLRPSLPDAEPAYLLDARSRPAWKRLVLALTTPTADSYAELLHRWKGEREPGEKPKPVVITTDEATQRARQLAGMVAPAGAGKADKSEMVRVILAAAGVEAARQVLEQAGRGGKGQPLREKLAPPSQGLDIADLDQERRALINNVAKCIHRRYFLSDKELADLTAEELEQRSIQRVLRQIIGLGEKQVGGGGPAGMGGGRPSALHAEVEQHLTAAYQKGLEVARLLAAGRVALATSRAQEVQEHRLKVMAAEALLEKARKKHHTGRFFHGDILSVRELPGDGTMIQHYTRLTIVYAADGHTVTVANAAELESLTGLKVGPGGWAALCRWIEDQSERMDGRKQGRRQDDDEHLIYRNHKGHLELRAGLSDGLVLALECVAQSLVRSDVSPEEIGPGHPAAGVHGEKDEGVVARDKD